MTEVLGMINIVVFMTSIILLLVSFFEKDKKLIKYSLITMVASLGFFILLIIVSAIKQTNDSSNTEPKQEKVVKKEKNTEESSSKKEATESSTEINTETSSDTAPSSSSEEPFDPANYSTVDYNEWNHDKVELASKVQITGEVIQAQKSGGDMTLRVKINDDYDQIVLVSILSKNYKDIIAENDNVTFYGINAGLTSYETVMGNEVTIPSLYATNYTVNFYGQ
ncbi:hypothetical protein MX111_03320 [Streptococcus uberis]|uniref:hypothetical protein n=1 Tax=Streptococcus uberis TaxID=1349 RepID=UPI0027DB18A8|nr:hypothetical protein [Streptococcus uberis]MCK1238477.1 hypothetical protein [Streptococcus uberis]